MCLTKRAKRGHFSRGFLSKPGTMHEERFCQGRVPTVCLFNDTVYQQKDKNNVPTQPRPTLDNAFRMPQAMLSPPNDSLVISKVLAISLC